MTVNQNMFNNPYAAVQQLQNLMGNNTNTMLQQQLMGANQQPQQLAQPVAQQNDFVTKDEFNKLMEENRKLREQLEKEVTQRTDIEFFKKEQEVLKLEEGRRALQELDIQKNKFYDTLWRGSDTGKEAMNRYRETIGTIYDRYAMGGITMPQVQPQPVVMPVVSPEPQKEVTVTPAPPIVQKVEESVAPATNNKKGKQNNQNEDSK